MITNKDAFWIGHWAGDGNNALRVAERLGLPLDQAAELTCGYVPPVYPADYRPVVISMASKHRTKIGLEANRREIEMRDLCRLTLEAVCADDLFGAVLDR